MSLARKRCHGQAEDNSPSKLPARMKCSYKIYIYSVYKKK